MSEYTQYYVVKHDNENTVQKILNDAKLMSIVDADQDGYWFSEANKRCGDYQWVVCTVAAVEKANSDASPYQASFHRLSALFDVVVHFFQDENFSDWFICLSCQREIIFKSFGSEKQDTFSEEEKAVFSRVFEKPFEAMQPFFMGEKGGEFLNFVGIPYMEMNDQSLLSDFSDGKKFSFLSHEAAAW